MLKKLLKYEFKSVSRILTPLFLGTLTLSIISALLFTINYRFLSRSEASDVVTNLFSTVLITILIFSIIAIIASYLVALFILLQRVYKNFFGDEGYLTFTLPATVNQHLVSKLISGFIWMTLSGLTVLVSGVLLIGFGTAESGEIINTFVFEEVFDLIDYAFEIIGTTNMVLYIIEGIVLVGVVLAAQLMLYYLAITIGCIIAKKHKILASIGVYFGINTATGTIINVVLVLLFMRDRDWDNSTIDSLYTTSHIYLVVIIALFFIMGAAAFFISNRMLKKNLNLE